MKRKLKELKQNCIFVATTNICTYLTYKLWGCGWSQQNYWNSEQITDLEITVCACTCAVVPGSSLFNFWCCIYSYCIQNMEQERSTKSKLTEQHKVCCEKLINFFYYLCFQHQTAVGFDHTDRQRSITYLIWTGITLAQITTLWVHLYIQFV